MGERVGFIGLGVMGFPMVETLVKAGLELVVHDVEPAVVARAAALPRVAVADSPARIAAAVRVLFTCLPGDEAVRSVYEGPDGIQRSATPGLYTCDCSTISPEITVSLHGALAARGVHHFDTPMIGGVQQAREGSIFFIVGGTEAQVSVIAPYLDIMGRAYAFVGPAGHAHTIKIANNALGLMSLVAIPEALALCARSGVSLAVFYETLRCSGFSVFSFFERKVPTIIKGDFTAVGRLDLAFREIAHARTLALQLGIETPIIEETYRTYQEAVRQGWEAEDSSAVCHVMESRLGRRFAQD